MFSVESGFASDTEVNAARHPDIAVVITSTRSPKPAGFSNLATTRDIDIVQQK